MKPRLIPLTLIPLILAACGPTYRTNYNLFPPASKEGQLCTSNVKIMSDVCINNCAQMARSCRSFSPGGLSVGYGTYGSGVGYGTSFGNRADILDDRDCSPVQCQESCLAAARTAHLSCGGTITEQTVCTANCPPPAVQSQP